MGRLVLVVGGSRSGKSKYAILRAKEEAAMGKVAFLATAVPSDEEMRRRIEEHRRNRPEGWETFEEPFEPGEWLSNLTSKFEVVVLDCLTLWLFNWFERLKEGLSPRELEEVLVQKGEELTSTLREATDRGKGALIVVSNEVGMGVVPPGPFDRAFCDALGKLNQAMAEKADEVVLVCCGIPLRVKP